ncbi:hypothetical protein ACFL6Z_04270 [Pseudomonadota bacterium]
MKSVISSSISNLKYTIFSQLFVISTGIFRVLFIPVILGVNDYGYWQIYMLYAGFIGIFTYGFNDGIYLRYGQYSLKELPFELIKSSLIFYILSAFITAIVMLAVSSIIIEERERFFVSIFLIVNFLTVIISSYFLFILQVTNNMRLYSKLLLIDKLLFVVLLLCVFLYENDLDFYTVIILDLISKIVTSIYLMNRFSGFCFGKVNSFRLGWIEFLENINVGYKLLLANLLTILLISLSRLFVEFNFSIESFSIFAFGLSLTGILILVANGVSVVIYPMLRRLDSATFRYIYLKMFEIISPLLLLFVAIFFVVEIIINKYIVNYKDVLSFLPLLLLSTYYQVRVQILNNSFFKATRRESYLIYFNIASILMFLLLTFLFYSLDGGLGGVAIAYLLTSMLKAITADFCMFYISKWSILELTKIVSFESVLLFVSYYLMTNNLTFLVVMLLLIFFVFYAVFIFRAYKGMYV